MYIELLLFLFYIPITIAFECSDNSTVGCVDGCVVNQCPIGSTCVPKIKNTYFCVCPNGLTHPLCEKDYRECLSNPCSNNASCVLGIDGVKCNCPLGFSGRHCEIFEGYCNQNPCLHEGKCEETINGYHCQCDGYEGKNCEIPFYFRINIPQCDSTSCLNNGTCSVINNSLTCLCSQGFGGIRCETKISNCSSNPCTGNKSCVEMENGYTCQCKLGFTGPNCMEQIKTCNQDSCLNGGICVDNICKCASGFSGDNCDHHDHIAECKKPSSCEHGICQLRNGLEQCFCLPGYTGDYCNMNVDECLTLPCQNKGTCIDMVNRYYCTCASGYTGKNCEIDIDECDSDPCYNNATCEDGINSYTCNCVAGFTGKNCELDINECESQPCLNGGQCVDHVNAFTCNCTDTGFTGLFCQNNIDDCIDAHCMSNSTCNDLIKDFECNCYPGYAGKRCNIDIDECANHPCENEGLCLERSNESNYANNYLGRFNTSFSYENASGYLCHCVPGFRGDNCSENINECDPNPCDNGECIDGINSYTCKCYNGFEGLQCELEIDECERFKPCFNESSCLNTVGDYNCDCPDNYGGKNCSVLLTGCINNLCENNSTCHQYLIGETEQDYNCSCLNGYYGRHCSDVTTMSLSGSRSVTIGLAKSNEHILRFRFRTTLPDGVLFNAHDGDTFYIVMLEKSELVVTFGFTGSTKEYRFGKMLNNTKWNDVQLEFKAETVTIVIHTHGESFGKLDNLTQPVVWQFKNLIMGGAPENGMIKLKKFVGCMEDVIVNGVLVSKNDLKDIVEVTEGCPRTEQCEKNTCNKHGTCTDLWIKFECNCQRPYIGTSCNRSYTPGTFGFENTTSLATITFPESIKHELMSNIKFSLFIRTRDETGFIFYAGNSGSDLDETFIALDIVSGALRLFIRNGMDRYKFPIQLKSAINNGDNHLIEIIITRNMHNNVIFSVNNSVVFNETITLSENFQIENLFLGSLPVKRSRLKRQQTAWYDFVNSNSNVDKTGGHDFVTLTPILLKNDNDRITENKVSNNDDVTTEVTKRTDQNNAQDLNFSIVRLKAVLQDIRVNDNLVLLFPLEIDVGNLPTLSNVTLNLVKKGVVSDDVCKIKPCKNGATCKDTYNDFICECPDGYREKTCSLIDYCFNFSCPSSSICRSLNDGYECISNATFDGETSFISYTSNFISPINAISFHYRSQRPGLILAASNSISVTHFFLYLNENHFNLIYEKDSQKVEIHLISTFNLTDGLWHKVKINFYESNIEYQLDSQVNSINKTIKLNEMTSDITIGGHSTISTNLFTGCLNQVRIQDILLPFFTDDELANNTSSQHFNIKEIKNVVNNECILCFDHNCENNGNCSNRYESFDCSCYGFSGQYCKEDIDECGFTDCHNGRCVNYDGSFECVCTPGFDGILCEQDINECQYQPCENGGLCENTIGSYKCICTSNYTGPNCKELVLVTCDNQPCLNGGTCQPSDNHTKYKFNCICPEGYTGNNCSKEKDFCQPGICNNGICFNDPQYATFKCMCNDGFNGQFCENNIDDCVHQPCDNGGTCIDGLNTYKCHCMSGFMGKNCQEDVNECEEDEGLCENDAICENIPGSFNCTCEIPYFGKTCSLEDPCLNDFRCDNKGTCMSDETNSTGLLYYCLCPKPYSGFHCQIEEAGFDANDLALILGPLTACILILVAIAVIVFLMMARKRRATKGTYSPSRQEMFGSRVELGHVMKPPPEERLI